MSEAAKPAGEEPVARLILVLGAVGFASAFTMRAVDPMVPLLAEAFGRTVATVALLATAFSLAYAVAQPILGPIGDCIGKARTILICLAGLAATLVASALAPGFEALTALRIAAGVFAGGLIPLAMAALGDRVGLAQRQVVLARFLTMVILGQMGGAVTAGFVSAHLGWRAVFLCAAAVAGAAVVLAALLLKPRPAAERTALSRAALAGSYRLVFANPRAVGLFALVMVEGAAAFGLFPFVAAFLAEREGLGAAEAGLVIGGFAVGGVAFGGLAAVLVRRLGPAWMVRLGGGLIALALSAFLVPKPWVLDIAIFALIGFGFYMMHNSFQTVATELAPLARGSAVSLFAGALFLGHALGPLLVGATKTLVGYAPAFLTCALAMAAVGLIGPRVLGPAAQRAR